MVVSKSNSKMFLFEFSMCWVDCNQRQLIEESNSETYLGVFINNNLKFDSHVKMVSKKDNIIH